MISFAPNNGQALRILCFGAHCDDIEIGCGGSLLKLIENKQVAAVKWVVFASNELRKKEAETCAHRFLEGVSEKEINILSFKDAFLPSFKDDIKQYFEGIKQSFTPDLIFTHYHADKHQDHRLVCELTWNTFRHHAIMEYEIPKYDGDLGQPNAYCQLNRSQVDRKIGLLLECFESQRSSHWFDEETFTALLRLRGLECANHDRYAEAFYARKWIWS